MAVATPIAAALRPIRGSWTLVWARFFLIVVATAPAWAKGWSVIAAGPARQPYYTDLHGPLPLPNVLRLFAVVGDKVSPVILGCAVLAVLLSALLSAGALAVLAPDRPARTWRGMVGHAWSEGWDHLPAFLRILLIEIAVLAVGFLLLGKLFDKLDIYGQREFWTSYTRTVSLPFLKLAASAVLLAGIGAWGLHMRLLTVADERRVVRRTAILALKLWRRRPLTGPVLFVVATLAGVLISGWVLVTWRQSPPASAIGAWMRMATWGGVLLLLAWLWHFLLRASRILADRPDVLLIRAAPDEGFGLRRFLPFRGLSILGLGVLAPMILACKPDSPPPQAVDPPGASASDVGADGSGAAVAAKPKTPPAPRRKRGKPPAELISRCGGCHKLPPPSVFAKKLWPDEIKHMEKIAVEQGVVAEGMDAQDVVLWYVLSAPERHTLYLGPAEPEPGPIKFVRRERNAAARSTLPGVSNVQFVRLTDGDSAQVLLTDMRGGFVQLFDPKKPQDGFQELARLKHPGRVTVADLDADGIQDVLVSELGHFEPTNDKKGAVIWLRGRPGGKFTAITLAKNLGRVADSQVADLDGDGDLDVVSAVFGWRTVGQVLAIERRGNRNIPHTLLKRTGALQAIPRDLDGDGRMDIVVLFAQEHERVSALMNRGDWKFEEEILFEAPHPAWGYSGMQLVDLDGDGDADILLTNGDTLDVPKDTETSQVGPEQQLFPYHGVSWLENQGGMKYQHRIIAPLYGAHRAQAADLDGDGDLDVVASSFLPSAPYDTVRKPYRPEALIWLERRSPDQWIRHTLVTMEVEIPTLDLGDMDGDGDIDIVTGHLFLGRLRPEQRDVSITIWENRGAILPE